MSEFAVIAQNGEPAWDDVKGELYHYPATYQAILIERCKYQVHPIIVQLDVKLIYSPPLIVQESFHIKGDLSL